MIPHGTPANLSDMRRRAIQFHWIKPGVKVVDTETRLKVYGAEGKGIYIYHLFIIPSSIFIYSFRISIRMQ